MGTHPIFESDFDCLTDMAVRKRNAKHDKQPSSKKPAEKNETNTRVKTIGIILGLVSIILFIKVQYTLVHSEMVSQTGDYRPGPAIVTTWKGVSREWATSMLIGIMLGRVWSPLSQLLETYLIRVLWPYLDNCLRRVDAIVFQVKHK